jgi:hypothetical protein
MNFHQPVTISNNSFIFCRWSLCILVWLGFLFKINMLIYLSFFLLLFSAILSVKHAPLIRFFSLFEYLFNFKKKMIMLDKKGMRFAHSLGALISGFCSFLLYIDFKFAWSCVFMFAIIKSISAFGICPGEKLYNCINDDKCCTFIRQKH